MPLLDDFNRANENPILSPWVNVTGTSNCQIISNAFAVTGAYGSAYYNLFQAQDQDIQVTIPVLSPSTDDGAYINFRIQNAASDATKHGYVAVLAGLGSNATRVIVVNPGPVLGTVVIGNATTWASGDICRITAIGAQITIYKNAVQVGTGSNSERIQRGYIMLQQQDTTNRFDDLYGTDLGTGPGDNPPIGFIGRGAGW